MAKQGLAARRAAIFALKPVLNEGAMLGPVAAGDRLSPADAARAGRLAADMLRHMGRIDELLDRFLAREVAPQVRMLLRMGASELMVEGAAAHGVVDSYVTLAKKGHKTMRAAGLINAVLRRVAADGPAIWAELPPQSLPGWLRDPLVKAYGTEIVTAIEAAHEAGAATDLTLRKAGGAIDGTELLPTGSLRVTSGWQISGLQGYDTGAFWVQDAAAALPVRLLGDLAGKRVLDLCAAPGGKTLQLAAAGALVTALDISEARLERLRENLARTGLPAEIVVADAMTWAGGTFDAILLDAPCSATGTIRRHPELPLIRAAEDLGALTKLQSRLLDRARGWLGPGGRIAYCTCSLLPSEGEDQVAAFLQRHPDMTVAAADPLAFGGEPHWASAEGGLRLRPDLWPDLGGMDGFYMAILEEK